MTANKDMMGGEKVSVITVSYNAADTIRKTIESVLNQTYSHMEYIIIDGASMDMTYQIVCEYNEKFEQSGIPYIHISESDNGIYDAMNKALDYSTGEWIYYLNANDRLFRNDTLGDVFSHEYDADVGCIYGNTWNVNDGKVYFKPSYNMDVIYYKAPFIHQALFVRKSVMCKYKFDINYRVSADYDLFVRMYINKEKFCRIDQDIAYFDLSGISQVDSEGIKAEWKDIQIKYGLYKKHKIRRIFRNNILPVLKKKKTVNNIYFWCMNLTRKII